MARHERSGFIQVPGGRVYSRILAPGAPGTPLLALHGGPGVPHDYLTTPLEALADVRPVVFYDQLGCGLSDRPTDTGLFTLSRFAEELARVRQALGLDAVHLLGQSFGAMLAVHYLLTTAATGVKSLILSGPCLSAPRFVADQRAHLAAMPAGIRQAVARAEAAGDCDTPAYQAAMTAFYRKHVCRLDPWPQCLLRSFEKTGQTVYVHMWGPSEFTATGTLRETDLTGELGRIALPTLLTCGRFDEATPETTAFYQSLLPGSQRHVFEDASHLHHLEKPEAYRRIVGDFLRRVEGAPEDENGQRSPGAGSREGEPAAGAPKG